MVELPTESEPVRVIQGDALEVLPTLLEASVDSCVTDPPYGLSFMGKDWDHGIPGVPFWEAVGRVLKPGGYMLAMGGTRTYHRLACAVEDAGFEIRDCLMWMYGSGFPKGKGCLKPAWEPILLCRKPGPKVLPLGVDECRVETEESLGRLNHTTSRFIDSANGSRDAHERTIWVDNSTGKGRWPANVVHDGSDEVLEAFAAFGELTSGSGVKNCPDSQRFGGPAFGKPRATMGDGREFQGDTGTAARFFYAAKSSREERGAGNDHPTVKPLALMRWLVKLVTPRDGIVLDPFLGSGSTLAAAQDWCYGIGIEREPAYVAIAQRRISEAMGRGVGSLFAEAV